MFHPIELITPGFVSSLSQWLDFGKWRRPPCSGGRKVRVAAKSPPHEQPHREQDPGANAEMDLTPLAQFSRFTR